jgi:hypothetical protein
MIFFLDLCSIATGRQAHYLSSSIEQEAHNQTLQLLQQQQQHTQMFLNSPSTPTTITPPSSFQLTLPPDVRTRQSSGVSSTSSIGSDSTTRSSDISLNEKNTQSPNKQANSTIISQQQLTLNGGQPPSLPLKHLSQYIPRLSSPLTSPPIHITETQHHFHLHQPIQKHHVHHQQQFQPVAIFPNPSFNPTDDHSQPSASFSGLEQPSHSPSRTDPQADLSSVTQHHYTFHPSPKPALRNDSATLEPSFSCSSSPLPASAEQDLSSCALDSTGGNTPSNSKPKKPKAGSTTAKKR